MKIVAMTCCVMDVFPQLNKLSVGGNSVNFAVGCHKSRVEEVAVLGAVGEDDYGEQIISRLRRDTIDTSHLHIISGEYTATHAIMISESGERLFFPENWQGGVYNTFRLSAEDWKFVEPFDILAGVANDPNFHTIVANKKRHQRLVADFLNVPDSSLLRRYLDKVDIAFASGTMDLATELLPVSKKTRTMLVITLGAEGSITLSGGKKYFQEALPVSQVIDTTGCGDAYQAAFTVAWYKYEDIRKAMLDGTIAANKVLTHSGAVD